MVAELYPALAVADARAALAFYEAAFAGARTPPTLETPDGVIVHAEIRLFGDDGPLVMLSEAESGGDPKALGGASVRMSVRLDDVDGAWAAAIAAGAEVVIPLADQFYGHRSGRLRDPFGHEWILSQEIERLAEADMQARMTALMSG